MTSVARELSTTNVATLSSSWYFSYFIVFSFQFSYDQPCYPHWVWENWESSENGHQWWIWVPSSDFFNSKVHAVQLLFFFFFVCTAPLVQSIGCMSDSAINGNKPSSRTGFNLGSSEIHDKDKRKVSLSREISVSKSLMIILHEDYILIVFSLENIPQYSLESLENVPGFFVN